jgi:hypothetical protein
MRIAHYIKIVKVIGLLSIVALLSIFFGTQLAEASALTKTANHLGIVAYYPMNEGVAVLLMLFRTGFYRFIRYQPADY